MSAGALKKQMDLKTSELEQAKAAALSREDYATVAKVQEQRLLEANFA